jgi:hypothetical protein
MNSCETFFVRSEANLTDGTSLAFEVVPHAIENMQEKLF